MQGRLLGIALNLQPSGREGCVRRSQDRLRSLTEREIEVLRLLASGRSNAGIAADLVISRRTVDAHLRSIFTKLGIEAAPDDNQRVLAALNWLTAHSGVAGAPAL
ncbi:MAG: helix-turn-helix transcriptional regulator [Microlunatus sp.]